jgi:hypothetical protein
LTAIGSTTVQANGRCQILRSSRNPCHIPKDLADWATSLVTSIKNWRFRKDSGKIAVQNRKTTSLPQIYCSSSADDEVSIFSEMLANLEKDVEGKSGCGV